MPLPLLPPFIAAYMLPLLMVYVSMRVLLSAMRDASLPLRVVYMRVIAYYYFADIFHAYCRHYYLFSLLILPLYYFVS